MSFLHKDTTFTKIFVGGLPYHTTDETLRKFFERFGEIDEAVVITDRQTGKSRGYGFVTMSTQDAANLATREPNPVIDGRKANVNLAYLGAKPRVLPSATGLIPLQLTNPYSPTLPNTYGIQPIYYQQAANSSTTTTALLTTGAATATLSPLLPNQSSTTINGGLSNAATPSYYELTYATGPNMEPTSFIYAPTAAFSYASLPGATPNLNDLYGAHSTKYIIDDHHGTVDRDLHQRTTAGW